MRVCLYMCVCVCILDNLSGYPCMRMFNVNLHTRTHVYLLKILKIDAHKHKHASTYAYKFNRAEVKTMPSYIYVYIYTHTYIHTYTHTNAAVQHPCTGRRTVSPHNVLDGGRLRAPCVHRVAANDCKEKVWLLVCVRVRVCIHILCRRVHIHAVRNGGRLCAPYIYRVVIHAVCVCVHARVCLCFHMSMLCTGLMHMTVKK